jgi:hypothetical protein
MAQRRSLPDCRDRDRQDAMTAGPVQGDLIALLVQFPAVIGVRSCVYKLTCTTPSADTLQLAVMDL